MDYRAAEQFLNSFIMHCASEGLCFRIHYWGVMERHYDNLVHKHSFFEICYVLNGNGEYEEEGQVHKLVDGTLFLSRPGIVHQIRSGEGMAMMYVAFELEEAACDADLRAAYWNRLQHAAHIVRYNVEESPSALYWRALAAQASLQPVSAVEWIRQSCGVLLTSLGDAFSSGAGSKARDWQPSSSLAIRIVQQAKHFIRDNIASPLSLQDVAQYLHLSERHLSRLFKQHSEHTFSGFVKHERIRAASELLLATSMSIKDIAEATGFQSVHYFTKVFAEEKGRPPGLYRKELNL
ncbi:AraC family transcriptional regulator [Paenibacillus sp. J5C2022]|uniref:AraC family transcriptional regulator n=1 Tax=Paenibacillus sp. J5C2022 TaxID=2977129 RepID=UPI0021D0518F|nr:AraC family transcriptional regulator [Paenibacillus sp. J5C2022]